MNLGARYQIIGILLTFLIAFIMASNFGSYHNPGEVVSLKESLIVAMDNQISTSKDSIVIRSTIDEFKQDIEINLVEIKYKNHSLFKIVGSFFALLGVFMLRRRKSIGLHLYVSGIVFILFTGFYIYGFGFVGWIFSIPYMMFGLLVGVYYFSKRKHLI